MPRLDRSERVISTDLPSRVTLCIQPLDPCDQEYRPAGFCPVPGHPWIPREADGSA